MGRAYSLFIFLFPLPLVFAMLVALADGALPIEKPTDRQAEILHETVGYSVLIDERAHRSFWMWWSAPEKAAWSEMLATGSTWYARYQLQQQAEMALAQSMYETVKAGHTVKVPALEAHRARLLSASVGHPEYEGWRQHFAASDRWLDPGYLKEVAAQQTPGYDRYDERALFVQANHAETEVYRTQLLLNPTWDGAPRVWNFEPMRVSLTWAYPWWVDFGGFCACAEWHTDQRMSETGAIEIHGYPDGRRAQADGVNPVTTDVRLASKIVSDATSDGVWQGYPAQTHRLTIDIEDRGTTRRVYRVTRIITDAVGRYEWLLIASSSRSPAEAERLFGILEAAVTLS